MCKQALIISPKLDSSTVRDSLASCMSASWRDNQRDGYGIAWGDAVERYEAHKWLSPKAYSPIGLKLSPWPIEYLPASHSFYRGEDPRQVDHPIRWMMLHGRTSTSRVDIEGVHPHLMGPITLVHNGVVSWDGPGTKPDHHCDSAQFALWLAQQTEWDVRHPDSLKDVWRKWSGYGVLCWHDTRTQRVYVLRSGAQFHALRLPSGGYVFATIDTDALVLACHLEPETWRTIGSVTGLVSVPDKSLTVIDPASMRIESVHEWVGWNGGRQWSQHGSTTNAQLCSPGFADDWKPSGPSVRQLSDSDALPALSKKAEKQLRKTGHVTYQGQVLTEEEFREIRRKRIEERYNGDVG